MQVFRSPFKSASFGAPDQGASGSGADAPVQDTSQMSPEELRALLQSQQEAIEHLQARLESLAVAERNSVPDLTAEAVEQMLGGDKVASWMRQSGEALRDYVRSASAAPARTSDVMGKRWNARGATGWPTGFGVSSSTPSRRTPRGSHRSPAVGRTHATRWMP